VADDDCIVKEVFIEATPQEIFPYLTETEKYVLWMGRSAELDARAGGTFKVDPNGRDLIRGEFLEVTPPRRVVFTWGWTMPGHPLPPGSTVVTINLIPKEAGTLLRLEHRALTGEIKKRHDLGWSQCLERLRIIFAPNQPGPIAP
jgi:uncharacterized protein YndB with AHSA1/START domain